MKRLRSVFLSAIIAVAAACAGFYFGARANVPSPTPGLSPEIAWLKSEFHLSQDQVAQISQLHEEYVSACGERCQLICAKNEKLQQLLTSTNRMTAEIEKALKDAAQLRANCQTTMLEYCYQISRSMPPEQGKRYLAWVMEHTCLADCIK